MRIFAALRHSIDPAHFYGGLWSANFYPALRQLGHEILESQVDLLPTSRFMSVASSFTANELKERAQATDTILAEVRSALRCGPVDLFLSYFYNAHFDPAGFDELRRLGVPTLNFYCNSINQFAQVAAIAAAADFSWHSERDARVSYLAVGANPVWVQLGAEPSVYFPLTSQKRQRRAVFVGQRYADRDRWLAALLRAGVPIDIYGSGWNNDRISVNGQTLESRRYLGRSQRRPGSIGSYCAQAFGELRNNGPVDALRRLTFQAKYRHETQNLDKLITAVAKGQAGNIPDLLASYEVYINFGNVWADGRPGSALIPHVRLRDFEGPMCRTCYLTGHTDEISEFYEVGKEIDTYRTEAELIDKTRYYLTHSSAAEKLREAGYRRAMRDHTWKRRFEELFSKLNLAQFSQSNERIA